MMIFFLRRCHLLGGFRVALAFVNVCNALARLCIGFSHVLLFFALFGPKTNCLLFDSLPVLLGARDEDVQFSSPGFCIGL